MISNLALLFKIQFGFWIAKGHYFTKTVHKYLMMENSGEILFYRGPTYQRKEKEKSENFQFILFAL